MVPVMVVAGDTSVTLPNGANLAVGIDDPLTCTELVVPSGEASIDVAVSGSASIGIGDPDATFVYVIDTSGSTCSGGGSGCSPVLGCEKQFFVNLNNAVIADGSTDLVGIVRYGSGASIALGLTDPGNPAVSSTINGLSCDGMTNCTDALWRARDLVVGAANDNGHSSVVFVSDGYCNIGDVTPARNALAATGAIVNSIAIGYGSSCTGDLHEIAANGGVCRHIYDPGTLGDLIENLIGSTLESLTMSIDGGPEVTVPNTDISLPLPQDGAVSVDYDTTAAGLDPDDHEICVTAHGSDVTGGTGAAEQCETIHLLQLGLGEGVPPEDTNDLNFEYEHTVTVQIAGGTGPDREVYFEVTGHNAGATGSATVSAPGSGEFTYAVPQECASLGTDTITVTTEIAGVETSIEQLKHWVDGVPPEVSCDPSVNPHGNRNPRAPGRGGQGQNQDGFYQLNAYDPTLFCDVTLEVTDGDGYVFSGILPGDVVKYTQDDSTPQEQKKMGSGQGQAGAVTWHLIGHGDLSFTATDTSGNTSAAAICLVPRPPM
jgi:hypothetical protein